MCSSDLPAHGGGPDAAAGVGERAVQDDLDLGVDRAQVVRRPLGTAKVLDRAFDDVGRTGLILEGFGVDHLHAKLFPMHNTAGLASSQWQPINSGGRKYFEKYEGYISSHDCERASDVELAALAAHIRRFA